METRNFSIHPDSMKKNSVTTNIPILITNDLGELEKTYTISDIDTRIKGLQYEISYLQEELNDYKSLKTKLEAVVNDSLKKV